MKKLFFIFLVSSILPLSSFAQKKDYFPGYIVKLDGDTIQGWIKDRSSGPFAELYRKIRFIPLEKRGKKKYSASEIRAYSSGNRHFESIPLREESAFFQFRYYIDPNATKVFLEVINRAPGITYYHLEFIHDDNDYLDFIPLFHKTGSNELLRVTQGILGLRVKRINEYFNNCPEVEKAIESGRINSTEDLYNFYVRNCIYQWN